MRNAMPTATVSSQATTARPHASGARSSRVTSQASTRPAANGHHTRRNPATPASSWWLRRPMSTNSDEHHQVGGRRDPGPHAGSGFVAHPHSVVGAAPAVTIAAGPDRADGC